MWPEKSDSAETVGGKVRRATLYVLVTETSLPFFFLTLMRWNPLK